MVSSGRTGRLPPERPQSFHRRGISRREGQLHQLQQLLEARAPWFQAGIKNVGWGAEIQFARRLARQFGRERAWLAGDAAHQTSPVGMQSMNMGMREGAGLAAKLKQILRDKGSPDLLEAYHRDYRTEWEHLLGLKGDPKAGAATGPWVRERRGKALSCLPASGSELGLLLRQLGLEWEGAGLPQVSAPG